MKKLLAIGSVSEVIYLLFWVLRLYHFPAASPYDLLKNNQTFGIVLTLGIVLSVLLFIASKYIDLAKISFKIIFGFAVLFNLTLLFILPVASDDLFSYVAEGRIVSQFHSNPYEVSYDTFKLQDPLYPKIKTVWSKDTSTYGPIITMFETAVTYIGGNNLFLNLFLFKTLFVAINLFVAWLIYKLTKSKLTLLLYSWNPIILFEVSLNAHNDILLILFFVLSLSLLTNHFSLKRQLLAGIVLVISILTKYYTIILAPIYLIYSLKNFKNRSDKLKYSVLFPVLGLVVSVLILLVFWQSPAVLSGSVNIAAAKTISPSLGVLIMGKSISWAIFVFIYVISVYKLVALKFVKTESLVAFLSIIFMSFVGLSLNLIKPQYLILAILLLSVCAGLAVKKNKYLYLSLGTTIYSFLLYFLIR